MCAALLQNISEAKTSYKRQSLPFEFRLVSGYVSHIIQSEATVTPATSAVCPDLAHTLWRMRSGDPLSLRYSFPANPFCRGTPGLSQSLTLAKLRSSSISWSLLSEILSPGPWIEAHTWDWGATAQLSGADLHDLLVAWAFPL